MRRRPPEVPPEDEQRIREALEAPIDERPAAAPRLDVRKILAEAKPTLKPVAKK